MRAVLRLSGMALVAMVLAAVAPMSARADLIVNGSFEDGVSIPGGFVSVGGGNSSSITGWTVLGGVQSVDYIGSFWGASDGLRSLDLDGTPGPGGIEQVINTVPGKGYVVTFDMAGNAARAPYVKLMQVAAIGTTMQSQVFSFDSQASTVTNMGWTNMQFEFVADAATTTLQFASLTSALNPDYYLYCGPTLDNVVVTPVPGAILLGALGLGSSGGVLAWRKRRTL